MIYIVEDDASIRELEQYALQSNGYEVQGFESAEPFWQAMRAAEPELVILDVMLPGEDGVEILKRLKAAPATCDIPVIMATAKGMEYDKVQSLDLGADDYLTKPFNILELKARIRALLRRAGTAKKQTPEQTLVCGHITLDRSSRSAFREDVPVDLTAKEFDLMELLMRNPNRVYSRETLLDAIWGYDVSSEIRTVDVHIRRLREKLEDNPAAPQHILTKWGVGYYLKD